MYKKTENFYISSEKLISFIENLNSKKLELVTISASLSVDNEVVLKYYFAKKNKLIILCVSLRKNQIASLFTYFSNSDFIEREISHTFGVKFVGNPNLNI